MEAVQSPTRVCRLCDSQMWEFEWVIFGEELEIVAYAEKMRCHVCGTVTESPMPGVNC